jgi:hypothetical protein
MNYDEIKTAWNVQADEHTQWDELSEDEKIEWAALHAAKKAHATASELLEALVEIISAADGAGWDQLDPTLFKARAAIAKAAKDITKG